MKYSSPNLHLEIERKKEIFSELFRTKCSYIDMQVTPTPAEVISVLTDKEIIAACAIAPGPDSIRPEVIKALLPLHPELFKTMFSKYMEENRFPVRYYWTT